MLEINDFQDVDPETIEKLAEFPIKNSENMNYNEFFHQHLVKNSPCLIKNLMKNWKAMTDFVLNNEPNIDFFATTLDSTLEVPVANCSAKYFNSQEKCSMTLQEYADYWKSERSELLYLKDWHFTKDHAGGQDFYQVPDYFKSDWLNEYWQDKNDDYKFVYLGPQGSWTPFHTDVFGSYSWSANVSGYKKWIFFQPNTQPQNVYDISTLLPQQSEDFDMKLKSHQDLEYFEVVQGPGEVIFVPSGWYHQVLNMTDTLSINHNWFNATNIQYIWNQLRCELQRVQKEISDCYEVNDEEWKSLCQKVLLASHGMNYTTFIDLLQVIMMNRVKSQSQKNDCLGPNHLHYDLSMVQKVLENVIDVTDDLLHSDMEKIKILLNKPLDGP